MIEAVSPHFAKPMLPAGAVGLRVLSLFDGMSCGQQALERIGVNVLEYYASEIDKHAIAVTMHNYPNTKQLGDVTKVKIKLLCLSEVYSYICNYDYNLQSNISEWEMLYWLNKDFTFSAKIGTQKPNERQEVSKSSTIQRIEEVWFSKHGMGSIRKFGDDTRSGSNGEENDIRISQQLQCNKWGYDNDIYRRYKEENIRIPIRETQNGYSEKKNFRNIEETIFKGKESESCFGENEKSNVEERCSGKLLEREGEDKFSRKVKKEKRNGREKESDSIDEVIRELCRWDEVNGITKDYWNILRLHKAEQITVVEHEAGFYLFKGRIDLCIGGSPCQGFSFAGKQLAFDDPRSKLFFEFVRLKSECNPTYFMLENVKMKAEHQNIISEILGVKPILINSELVSAQSRERLYWTNIPITQMPTDKGILLKDIIEIGEPIKDKSQTILATLYKENAKSMIKRNKAGLLVKMSSENPRIKELSITDRGIRPHRNDKRKSGISEIGTIHYPDTKSYTITANHAPKVLTEIIGWRKLTPKECERLQTVPDNYTDCVSDTQRYKMLGNGWTVSVISHIFSYLPKEYFEIKE